MCLTRVLEAWCRVPKSPREDREVAGERSENAIRTVSLCRTIGVTVRAIGLRAGGIMVRKAGGTKVYRKHVMRRGVMRRGVFIDLSRVADR
ncbi:hypothetical protein ACLB2K_072777 [Fragaria x ananassa]